MNRRLRVAVWRCGGGLALVGLFTMLLAISAAAPPADGAGVLPAQPIADVVSGTAPLSVQFSIDEGLSSVLDSSKGRAAAPSYQWFFGDGSRATGERLRHTFERPGRYTVYLLTYDGVIAALSDPLVIEVEPAPAGHLLVSEFADRGAPEPLDGAILLSNRRPYIFLDAPAGDVSSVEFVFGDPETEPIFRTEQVPPYDLMGGGEVANALDLSRYESGRVTLTAIVHSDTGEHRTSATFEIVDLSDPAPGELVEVVEPIAEPDEPQTEPVVEGPGDDTAPPVVAAIDLIQVSDSPARSNPAVLDGMSFVEDDLIYVFADVDDESVALVEFFLDDPLAQGTPHRTEALAPFDLVGGTSALALPLDLRTLGPGVHVLTTIVVFEDGSTTGVIVSFVIDALPETEAFL